MLEENIVELETRIQELESRGAQGPPRGLSLHISYTYTGQPDGHGQPGGDPSESSVWDEEYLPIQISDTL